MSRIRPHWDCFFWPALWCARAGEVTATAHV